MRAAYEARVAGDRAVATDSWEVPGGVRFSTPELPGVRDYNGVVLGPGAPIAVDDDVARVNASAGTCRWRPWRPAGAF